MRTLVPAPCDNVNKYNKVVKDDPRLKELLESNAQLRGALIFAGRRIQKQTFGRKDDDTMPTLRRALKEARAVARKFKAQ